MPQISIIVTVYNGAKTLSNCLDSLIRLDFPQENREIIVVDNNSTDNTKEIISQYPVKYVFEPIRGRGRARNAGIRVSLGKYIAFTDADCIADRNWLKELIKGFEVADIVACAGKIVAYKTNNCLERYAESRELGQERAVSGDGLEGLPYIVTANAMFIRDILEKLGYFDEDLITSEDTEMGWQFTLSGLNLQYIPNAIIYHQHRNTFGNFCSQQFEFGSSSYMIFKKYGLLENGCFYKLKYFFSLFLTLITIPFRFITEVITLRKEKKSFLLLDNLTNIFYYFGQIKLLLRDIFFPQLLSLSKRPNLNKVYYHNLQIHNNSYAWLSKERVVWFLKDSVVKILNFKNHTLYGLNCTATRIWQVLLDVKEILLTADLISQQFGISKETALEDIEGLISQLERESILIRKRRKNK
ncbi:MAG: PqqD family peptide modification chaperone [Candidatus Omnitrophota bacterium]|nr:PqqD family peptide modification chaperone [Candidatus Omnitrophota bacterium]